MTMKTTITMKTITRVAGLACLVSNLGCGDTPGNADEVGGTQESSTTQDSGTEVGNETGSGTAESSDSATTTTTATTDATTDATTSDSAESGPQTKFDIGTVPDTGFMNCGGGDSEFSYLWAANSDQGTISKIDTKTVTEVGRYIVRPDSNGSPSRTSVSLSGNVVVANRSGGVTKIYANPDLCQESNGTPGIQTSNSAAFLPWGQEECVAWHTPFGYISQRPVAWTAGDFNQGTCQYDNEEVFTSGNNQDGHIDILVLDGEDGSVKETVAVPTGGNGLGSDYYGIYGGAVDGDGNFWGTQLGGARMVKVVRADMSYQVINTPGAGSWYGMTVDSDGMVWLCSSTVARYDPMTQSWAQANVGGYTGCMADASENGLLWMSNGSGVIGVNRDTLQVEKTCNGNGSYGVSIDFEGYVWAVAYGTLATKWDPTTCESWSYNGLVGAYTYSDMTGYALSNAGTPSG